MMQYKNTKGKVQVPYGDTDYFDIVLGVLQWDTLAPYLFITYLAYRLRTSIDLMKENGFTLAKERSRRHSAQTIADEDYADDITLRHITYIQQLCADTGCSLEYLPGAKDDRDPC